MWYNIGGGIMLEKGSLIYDIRDGDIGICNGRDLKIKGVIWYEYDSIICGGWVSWNIKQSHPPFTKYEIIGDSLPRQ